jgi:hypothetical protein
MNTMRKIYFSAALAILGCGNLHAQFGMDFSFSFGDGATADAYGFAHGAYTQAAANAFAFGDYAYAGYGAYGTGIAIGYDAEAYGGSYEAGIAIGGWSEAQPGSAAFGFNAYAGDYSVAVGSSTIASGTYSAAFGRSAQAIGPRSIAAGAFSYAPSFGGIALGFGNKAKRKDNSTPSATAQANDPVLMVGNAPSTGIIRMLHVRTFLLFIVTVTRISPGRCECNQAVIFPWGDIPQNRPESFIPDSAPT